MTEWLNWTNWTYFKTSIDLRRVFGKVFEKSLEKVWNRRLKFNHKKNCTGISLVVQWLRLHAPNTGCPGLKPGLGTKILHAMWHSQEIKINLELWNHFFFFKLHWCRWLENISFFNKKRAGSPCSCFQPTRRDPAWSPSCLGEKGSAAMVKSSYWLGFCSIKTLVNNTSVTWTFFLPRICPDSHSYIKD